MHIHILGICGTFMGGIAQLAKAMGHKVTGSDANVYPPMSTQLSAQGIEIYSGYASEHLIPAPDQVVVGNAMTRGNPAIEYLLNTGLRYTSGPQWLAEHVLHGRVVLAVAGTHGKTTTAAMLAWILEYAGRNPSFLIGGVPANFGVSARLGNSEFFVVEADEYDTAFFDKRSKFIHYHPNILILNNLEMDHADIFDNLAQIQRQFHHLVRTVPASGHILYPALDSAVQEVLDTGCWSHKESFAPNAETTAHWHASNVTADGNKFEMMQGQNSIAQINWNLTGHHNVANAVAAIAAAFYAGIAPKIAVAALNNFQGVKRRMELHGIVNGIAIYDDFAHHPTAIRTTLHGLRAKVGAERIFAVLEPRSNTMRLGTQREQLTMALEDADRIFVYAAPELSWDAQATLSALGARLIVRAQVNEIIQEIVEIAHAGDHILIMSNGGFAGIHQRLLNALSAK